MQIFAITAVPPPKPLDPLVVNLEPGTVVNFKGDPWLVCVSVGPAGRKTALQPLHDFYATRCVLHYEASHDHYIEDSLRCPVLGRLQPMTLASFGA